MHHVRKCALRILYCPGVTGEPGVYTSLSTFFFIIIILIGLLGKYQEYDLL